MVCVFSYNACQSTVEILYNIYTSAHTEEVLYHCVGPDTALRHGDDYNGLYSVNPMNQINQYSEVVNQYAEVGLKGQERSRAADMNGEYENSSHSKVGFLFQFLIVYLYTNTRSSESGSYG